MVDNQESHLEMCTLMGSGTDLGNSPFRSLRPRSQVMDLGSQDGVYSPKTQGPVVCSVAPHFPARPPSNSDNESVMKHNWNADYEGMLSCRAQNQNKCPVSSCFSLCV